MLTDFVQAFLETLVSPFVSVPILSALLAVLLTFYIPKRRKRRDIKNFRNLVIMDLKRFEILDKPGQAEAVAPEFQVGEYQFFANSPTARALLSEEECAHIREVSNLLNRCNRDWGDLSFNPDDARHHAAAQKLMDRRRRLHNILAYLERALERI